MKYFLAGLSAIIAIGTLVISAMFFASSGGFINLGPGLALLTLALGNVLCFIPNLGAYWLGYRHRWFISIILIQSVFIVICLCWVANDYIDSYRGRVAVEKLDTLRSSIEQDDLKTFINAKNNCTNDSICKRRTWDENELLSASKNRAYHIAAWMVEGGVTIGRDASDSARTCEGVYLSSINSLGWAVAHDDYQMLAILLPASDNYARYKALELAAKTNRLGMLQWLVEHGVSLDSPYSMPYPLHDQGKGLLIAAAEGAAARTALWLIDVKGVPVEHDNQGTNGEISPLLWAYWRSIMQEDSPETLPFLMLMVEHGANLDASDSTGVSLLQWTIRLNLPNIARSLLSAGASTQYFSDQEQLDLQILLTQER